jgi:uncharacterized protein YkwD
MTKRSKYCLVLFYLAAAFFLCAGVIYGAGRACRLSAYEKALLYRINQYRASKGLSTLSADETLQRLARIHSRYMERENSLNHDHFDDRFKKCGRMHCVENCGWNYPTPEDQLKAWINSKGHYANLVARDIKFAGVSKVGAYVTFFACD